MSRSGRIAVLAVAAVAGALVGVAGIEGTGHAGIQGTGHQSPQVGHSLSVSHQGTGPRAELDAPAP
jgi:hypothetical protein